MSKDKQKQEFRDMVNNDLPVEKEKLDNEYEMTRMIKQNENDLRQEFDLDVNLNKNKG